MSRIDELQRLHEAHERHAGDAPFDVEAIAVSGMELRRALAKSWPAIHRVLVAARMLMRCPRCIGPCDDPTVHAELGEALRALDGGA